MERIKQITEKFVLDDDIENIFKIESEFIKYIPKSQYSQIIGKYVGAKEYKYFASPEFETEIYTEIKIPTLSLSDKIRGKSDKPYKIECERQVVTGYSLNSDYLYEQIRIEIESNYPNVNSYQVVIAFVCSDKEIRIYNFFTNYNRKNWDTKELDSRYNWDASDFELTEKESIYNYVNNINNKTNEKIHTDLSSKFENKIQSK